MTILMTRDCPWWCAWNKVGMEGDVDCEAEAVPEEGSTAPEESKEEKETSHFCVEILPLIKESQSQHGLRHGDYQRYRLYCTRRVHRIRRSLHFTQGHRNRYQKKPLTSQLIVASSSSSSAGGSSRYLHLPLVCAERAWALAMELKQGLGASGEPRKRFHILRRLKKAAKYAEELLRLCEECGGWCDVRTKLEAQAYCSWMAGNVKFEQQKWQEALDAFGSSQTIYEKLAGAVPEEQRAQYTQRVEELTPNIRYCAYNIKDMPTDVTELMKLRSEAAGSDILASKIDLVLAQTQQKTASSLTEVAWLGKQLPVKNERLRVSLVKLQQMVGDALRWGGGGGGGGEQLRLYEALLMECQDAMQIVRDEINELSSDGHKKRSSQKSEAHRANLVSLLDYLTHQKLTHTISRNRMLLANMKEPSSTPKQHQSSRTVRPEEFVRVYDILLQNVSDLSGIPGFEDDLYFQKECAARTFAFKANRCFHLAESYANVKKLPEAVALLNRALEHLTQALALCEEEQSLASASSLSELQKLQETIRGRKCELHVKSILEKGQLEEDMSRLSLGEKPVVCHTDELLRIPPGQKLVTLAPIPPDYKPVPCKPLFYDLALNHIEFPSLAHRVEKKGKGITGFMKGLIWGST